jgi:hypothetical protein
MRSHCRKDDQVIRSRDTQWAADFIRLACVEDEVNQNICAAISKRAVVRFYYEGGIRTVEPHCHGTSTAGNEALRGFQTGGYSESGNPVGWKLFDVSKISAWGDAGSTFASNRPGYNPQDRGMSRVHCHV